MNYKNPFAILLNIEHGGRSMDGPWALGGWVQTWNDFSFLTIFQQLPKVPNLLLYLELKLEVQKVNRSNLVEVLLRRIDRLLQMTKEYLIHGTT